MWTARPSDQVGKEENQIVEGLLSICACTKLVEDGGVLRPRPSRSLGTSNPLQVHLIVPREQRWLETEHALEGSESSGLLTKGILCVLGPANKLVPRVLVAVAEGSQETSDFLDLSLCLPVGLRLVPRR